MVTGTYNSDVLIGRSNDDVFGLYGDDMLTAGASNAGSGTVLSNSSGTGIALVGGQGADIYNIGLGTSTLVLEDRYSAGDSINIADDFNNTQFYLADDRHLVAINETTGARLIVADWQNLSNAIETWNVNGISYSYGDFRDKVTGDLNYSENVSFNDLFGDAVANNLRQAILTLPQTEKFFEAQSLDNTFHNANTVYRFYNEANGQHFYTASAEERDTVVKSYDQFVFEGPAFNSTTSGNDLKNVYRFYNPASGEHFYTANEAERASIAANDHRFTFEGTAYQAHSTAAAGSEALYRFYDSATQTHFYTASATERDSVIAHIPTYHFEGVAYYVDGLA